MEPGKGGEIGHSRGAKRIGVVLIVWHEEKAREKYGSTAKRTIGQNGYNYIKPKTAMGQGQASLSVHLQSASGTNRRLRLCNRMKRKIAKRKEAKRGRENQKQSVEKLFRGPDGS